MSDDVRQGDSLTRYPSWVTCSGCMQCPEYDAYWKEHVRQQKANEEIERSVAARKKVLG